MPHDTIHHVLTADVAQGGTFAVPFPANRVPESYIYYEHKLSIPAHQKVLSYVEDPYEPSADNTFFVQQHLVADVITVYYYGPTPLPAGTRVVLELALAEDVVQVGLATETGGLTTLDLAAFPHCTEIWCQANNASTTEIDIINADRLLKRVVRIYNVTGNTITVTDGNIAMTIRAGVPNRHEVVVLWNNVDWSFIDERVTKFVMTPARLLGSSSPSGTVPVDITPIHGYFSTTNLHIGGFAGNVSQVAAALTLNLGVLNVFRVAKLTESITTVTISAPQSVTGFNQFWVRTIQGATPFAITWPGSVAWKNRITPTLSQAEDAVDIFHFITTDGGTTWRGQVVWQAEPSPIQSATAANVADVGHSINTLGKHLGKMIWESTNSRIYAATGRAAADPWYLLADATGAVTPS